MEIMDVDKRYKEIENLLACLISKFMETHYGDEEDLRSACHEGFVIACKTYTPDKSKFSTWVYNNMWWKMLDHSKKEVTRIKQQEIIDFEQVPQKDYNHKPLSELYDILTDDAKCICEVLLDLSPEILQSFKDSGKYIYGTKRAIRNLFLDIGWPEYRIKNAFRDLHRGLIK